MPTPVDPRDIAAIESEILILEERLATLNQTLSSLRGGTGAAGQVPTSARHTSPPRVNKRSSAAEKIALFRALFSGRTDVYAHRWTSGKTGKSNWSPAVRGRFSPTATDAAHLPLTDQVIERHLLGARASGDDLHVGLYPMLHDDTCRLLVCDFDDGTWKADASAYAQARTNHAISAATEISR